MTNTEPKHVATFNGDNPVIVALDTSASMNVINAAHGKPRYQYALERIDELLSRLPRDTRVTVLTFDALVTELGAELTAMQARGVLQLAPVPAGATTNTGRVFEHVLASFWNGRRQLQRRRVGELVPEATVLLVTDGATDDAWRMEAFLRELTRLSIVQAVIALWVGDDDTRTRARESTHSSDPVLAERMRFIDLTEDTEIRISTHTASDKPEAARAPTVPPSLSPPKPVAAKPPLGRTAYEQAEARELVERAPTPKHAEHAEPKHAKPHSTKHSKR